MGSTTLGSLILPKIWMAIYWALGLPVLSTFNNAGTTSSLSLIISSWAALFLTASSGLSRSLTTSSTGRFPQEATNRRANSIEILFTVTP